MPILQILVAGVISIKVAKSIDMMQRMMSTKKLDHLLHEARVGLEEKVLAQ